MKSAKQMCVVLVVIVMLLGAYHQGRLVAADAVSPAKIGVVNVTEVLEKSQVYKRFQEKMKAEQAVFRKELETLKNEMEALDANLKLRKPGSEDYLSMLSDLTQKEAMFEAKKKINSVRTEEKMRQWTEQTYQELVGITEELAQKKGLDMVMSTEKIQSGGLSFREFMISLSTKKFLYFNPKYDLTAEAIVAMDNAQ